MKTKLNHVFLTMQPNKKKKLAILKKNPSTNRSSNLKVLIRHWAGMAERFMIFLSAVLDISFTTTYFYTPNIPAI